MFQLAVFGENDRSKSKKGREEKGCSSCQALIPWRKCAEHYSWNLDMERGDVNVHRLPYIYATVTPYATKH